MTPANARQDANPNPRNHMSTNEQAQEATPTESEGAKSEVLDAEAGETGISKSRREGKALLADFRGGSSLTRTQAISAKCADCMGEYRDGRNDCRIPTCPLYPWMPYR